MSDFITENIGRLTVRPLPDGNWEVGFASDNAGMHHQLYVNGALCDWTDSPLQRRFLLQGSPRRQQAAVVAVAEEDRGRDFSASLPPQSAAASCTVRLSAARQGSSAPAGSLVLLDDHAGASAPSVVAVSEYWPARCAACGAGQDRFGQGGFGFGGDGGPGLGRGLFAEGPFGFDVEAVVVEAQLSEEGLHQLVLGRIGPDGRTTMGLPQEVLVLPPPAPAQLFEITGYDPRTSTLTLHFE